MNSTTLKPIARGTSSLQRYGARRNAMAAALAIALTTSGAMLPVPAQAQAFAATQARDYAIPAGDLRAALDTLVAQSDISLLYAPELAHGKVTQGARGRLSATEALQRLLAGSGLEFDSVDEATYVIRAKAAARQVPASRPPNAQYIPPVEPEPTDIGAIVVTGTRIRGTGPIGSPLTTIDRTTLDNSGRATLADFIQTIPQNFSGGPTEANIAHSNRGNALSNIAFGTGINLRGLGSGSTLTLFDGARPALAGSSGAFADLSLLPSSAVERIEILTDGASAIYGSDAVAGVVNIRFRNNFEGFETRFRAGTAHGDYTEYQASQLFGTRWATGQLVVAGEYYLRGNLPSTSRSFATEDLRRFGGPDLRSNYANPGTIVAANGSVFRIPTGQDGTNLSPTDLIPGSFNRGDGRRHIDILPRQETASLYASTEQRLGDKVTLFARGLYAERQFKAGRRIMGPFPLTVTAANPYYVDPIGTGQPISVYYDPAIDFGPEGVRGSASALNTTFGARTDIGSWLIELTAGHGLQRDHYEGLNLVHRLRIARALAATDPTGAINVFGDGQVNDAALIDSLRGSFDARTRYSVSTAALRADGTLLALPAGDVKLALGAEYRRDRFTYFQVFDLVADTPMTSSIPGMPDQRIVRALYSELAVPILNSGTGFPGELTASIAGRHEKYSDVGDTTNPKFGMRWTPVPGLSLRTSYGRSFRAPYFDQLVGAANAQYQALRVSDPQSPSGQSIVLGLFGFRPDLGPEKAESWTAGFDFEPTMAPGFKASASWFDIHYRDRISGVNTSIQGILPQRATYAGLIDDTPDPAAVAGYFASPSFSNTIGATPGDIQMIIDARTRNLSSSRVRGIDFDISFNRPMGQGVLNLAFGGSRLLEIDDRITDTAPHNNVVGTLGNPVKLRLRGNAGFALGMFDGGLGVNHVDSYRNLAVVPAARVKRWTTFDLYLGTQIGWQDNRSLRLVLSVNNLFDKDPPYVQFPSISSVIAYDPEQASAAGRTLSLSGVVSW